MNDSINFNKSQVNILKYLKELEKNNNEIGNILPHKNFPKVYPLYEEIK